MPDISGSARTLGAALRDDLLTRDNVIVVGLLAVVGVLGLVGGFAPAPAEELPRYAGLDSGPVGPIDVGDADVTLTGVRDGVLTGEITVTGERSIGDVDAQRYFSMDGLDPYGSFLARPGAWHVLYSPGVPTAFEIALPSGGGELTLNSQTYRASSLDGSMRYFDRTPVAVVELP